MQDLILEVKGESPQATLDEFFRSLLERGVLDALLLPLETGGGAAVAHALVLDPSKLRATAALAPVSPVNAAGLVSCLTFGDQQPGRLGVVLRSCESRALVELVKLKQASMKSLLVIGVDCAGTFEPDHYCRMVREGLLSQASWIERENDVPAGAPLRTSCRICPGATTPHADLHIGWIGMNGKRFLIRSSDGLAKELIEKIGLAAGAEPAGRVAILEEMRNKRLSAREECLADVGRNVGNVAALSDLLTTCRRCYNCREACPVCFCRQCVFTGETFDYRPDKYFQLAGKKGLLKMPAGTLLFHITRINHMGMSCVGCGQCESACPVGLPLTALFQYFGSQAASVFDYMAGRDLDEKLPLSTYREVELEPR